MREGESELATGEQRKSAGMRELGQWALRNKEIALTISFPFYIEKKKEKKIRFV